MKLKSVENYVINMTDGVEIRVKKYFEVNKLMITRSEIDDEYEKSKDVDEEANSKVFL